MSYKKPRRRKPRGEKSFKPEFRQGLFANRNHPVYVYDKIDGYIYYISITHAEIHKGVKTIELEMDPNPKSDNIRKSYLVPIFQKARSGAFGKTLIGWKFQTDKDKVTANTIVTASKKNKHK